MDEYMTLIAADSRSAQGGDEYLSVDSPRTEATPLRAIGPRMRGRAGANAAIGRSSER
jgi:hypothetical protein